ncbi:beta-ketoacyl synthase N-terminal-like domain-containing protein, partial [Klebsiella aerogenes]
MKTSRKRVVITGMGILSSLADNIADFRQALLAKKNGIADSARFSKWFANARAAEMLHKIHCP